MGEVSFNKHKYIFSNKNKGKEIKKQDIKREVQLLLRELNLYKINLKILINKQPTDNDRNLILNISYYIVENELLLDKIIRRKDISSSLIAKNTNVDIRFIEKWKGYIMSYSIILSNDKFENLYKYLNITFRELEIISLVRKNNDDNHIYKGIVLSATNKNASILTRRGEFIRINNGGENKVGYELSGKEKKGFRHYKHIVIAFIIIFIMTFGTFIYSYTREASTIVIQSTSKIKLEVNKFNKVVYTYSPTEKGSIVLLELNLKHKDIGDSLELIFKSLSENKMVPGNNTIEVLVTGKRISTEKFSKLDKFIKSINSDNNYDNNIKLIINNAGYEKLS